MDPSDARPVPMAAQLHFVACGRCHRIVAVLVGDHSPSFRDADEQAECAEVRERRARGELSLDLMVCRALRESLEARFESSEVEAVASQGSWYVVRRTPDSPSPLYSPDQARAQAELLHRRGQEKLAKQFRRAADQAEFSQFRDDERASKTRRTVAMLLILLAIVGGATWYFLLRERTQVADLQSSSAPIGETAHLTPQAAPPPAATPAPGAPAVATPAPAAGPPKDVPAPQRAAARANDAAEPPPPPASAPPNDAAAPPRTPAAVPAPQPPSVSPAAQGFEAAHATPQTMAPPQPLPVAPRVPQTSPSATDAATSAPAAGAATGPVAAVTPVEPPAVQQPAMVSLPGGVFEMGSNEDPTERPVHQVTIKPFAISKFPVMVREWNECVAAGACAHVPMGRDDEPAANLSWSDTQQFVAWLARTTHRRFRLPSEAEWEYAARGGTRTRYWWGEELQRGMANCRGCGDTYDSARPAKVGSFKPNPFGLYDMGGGVDQWVADCWHKNYRNAPTDGSTWLEDNCPTHVIRSGSWKNESSDVRAASRDHYDTSVRYPTLGFRIALSL